MALLRWIGVPSLNSTRPDLSFQGSDVKMNNEFTRYPPVFFFITCIFFSLVCMGIKIYMYRIQFILSLPSLPSIYRSLKCYFCHTKSDCMHVFIIDQPYGEKLIHESLVIKECVLCSSCVWAAPHMERIGSQVTLEQWRPASWTEDTVHGFHSSLEAMHRDTHTQRHRCIQTYST